MGNVNSVRRFWPAAVAALLVVQIAVMAALPESWLTAEVIALTALSALAVARVVLIMWRVEERPPAPDDNAPSPLMLAGVRMARAGAPATRIAEHCRLPLALAELMVSEANSAASAAESDGPESAPS